MIASIIQARLSSTRFPRKVITPLGLAKRPSLQILIKRLSLCKKMDKIIVAIPTNEDEFYHLCSFWNFKVFRGSPDNVRERVLEAAKFYGVDKIVDITADCPLIDPEQVDALVQMSSRYKYCSNIDPRTWPDGFDVQVYDTKLLDKVHRMNPSTPHVGWQILDFIRKGILRMETFNLPAPPKLTHPKMRLTLDTPEDGIVIDRVLKDLGEFAPAEEIIEYMLEHPELQNINAGIRTKLPEEG